jgi:hypothetical protein
MSIRVAAFVHRNERSLQATGVPVSIYESHEMFIDFLMHGHIDHHDDPTRFSVGSLSVEQQSLLADVIASYFLAGFDNPGIAGLMTKIGEEARRKVAEFQRITNYVMEKNQELYRRLS